MSGPRPGDEEFLDMAVFDEADPDEALEPEEVTVLHELLCSSDAGDLLDETTWEELVVRAVAEPQLGSEETSESRWLRDVGAEPVEGLSAAETAALQEALFPTDDNPFDDPVLGKEEE
jgi:hypothetical protein